MAFSAYLVGTWERRNGVTTTFQVINPTVETLSVLVAFFDKGGGSVAFPDKNGKFIRCLSSELAPNQAWEIVLPRFRDESQFGVAKFISHDREGIVKPGIVGFQRHALTFPRATTKAAFSESPLAAVPAVWYPTELPIEWKDYPKDEFEKIRKLCP